MRGMGRLWQAAGTVNAVLAPDLLERAVEAGLRSLFVGFETLNPANLVEQRKYQNLRRDYAAAIRRLHDLGVMINGSFVFGMDGDDGSVFERTVEWAIEHGIETATFHILTPYPGTALYRRMAEQGRITTHDWDCTTRVTPSSSRRGCRPEQLERGYHWAYREFYRWRVDRRGARRRTAICSAGLRHFAYAAGWKKFEPLWDLVIRAKRAGMMLPVLEAILSEFGRRDRCQLKDWSKSREKAEGTSEKFSLPPSPFSLDSDQSTCRRGTSRRRPRCASRCRAARRRWRGPSAGRSRRAGCPFSSRTCMCAIGSPAGWPIAACGRSSMLKPGPGSAMRYSSIRLARRHAIRTVRDGSSLPPHSMAFSSSSRKA